MRKEGKINYDSMKIVRILIISILIVLILIIGSLIYVFMSGEKKTITNAPLNYSDYYRAYLNKDISLCNNDTDKTKENYCKISFAQISGNASVCGLLDKSVVFPYLSKAKRLKLNLNAVDFCYIALSISKNNNYCAQIKDEAGKAICMEDLA